ncbi:hypothetical protein BKA82DRAFT_4362557 [Pisolithus tinctorius]|nr:hypothetical protein BKA82DRAFT_4362557 [Pisolithus tinctorius]
MALSEAGLMPAIFNLANEAACITCFSPYDDMHHHIVYLEDNFNDCDDEICHLQDKLDKLHHADPAPIDLDHHIHDQPGAGPSCLRWPSPLLREQQSLSQHGWPHHPPMEDMMMVNHALNFLDVTSDIHMTLDESAPSAHVQGTMFPEFDGTEWPPLSVQSGQRLRCVKHNLKLHVIPPVPVGKWQYGWAIHFEGGILGPISFFNTANAIHQLYLKVLKEPEEKAPCVQKVQDLITFLNLWKRCKLGLNKVIDLTLSKWKPLLGKATHPQAEEEQASAVGIPPPMPGPSGGAPALLEQIADAPVAPTPVPGVRSTPTPAFIDHVVVQPHEAQPASEQHPGLSSQAESSMRTQPPHKAKGAKPSSGKSRGIPKLPSNAPSLDSPIEVWRNFINKEQKHPHWDNDSKSMLMDMLPGVLGTSSRPDDPETESNPHLCETSKDSSSMSAWCQSL